MFRLICFLALIVASLAVARNPVAGTNLASYAFAAKQIAPGATRVASFGYQFGACDSCDVSAYKSSSSAKTTYGEKDDLSAYNVRIEVSLLSFLWPRLKDFDGAENFNGNNFGGGVFLGVHYAPLLEFGINPTFVQWLGPFYVAASYDLSFGYYVHCENDERCLSEALTTGTANIGGGATIFMNNHGISFGMHGGLRQMHLVEAELYHVKDWVPYCGLDFGGYSNLPLLKETRSKSHFGYLMSLEMGIRTDNRPMRYWTYSWSFFL